MTVEKLLLLLHLVGLCVLLAGVGIATLSGIRIGKATTAQEALAAAGIGKTGGMVILPGALTLLVTGLALVWVAEGWEVTEPWIVAAIVLWVVSIGLGDLQKRYGKSVAMTALPIVQGGGTTSDELQALLASRAPTIRGNILNLLILVFLVLMIWKPGH